jgi:CubicO group peptidase (beta-lactamase class C family)
MVKKILLALLLIILVFSLYNWNKVYRLYKVLTLFEAENISENFRSMTSFFPYNSAKASENPYLFPVSTTRISLPNQFFAGDSLINTKDFLDFTLTDGFMILSNDTIVYESYSNGFIETDLHISWSMSKSVISALFGIAISEGKIGSIEEKVTDYLPELTGTGYDDVRIKDVLQMSSGVGFNEDYGDFFSDINRMGRYIALGKSMDEFASSLTRARTPGTFNHYVSIDTHVLGMILKKSTGKELATYMEEKLWNPLGAESEARWIVDDRGMEFALGGLNITLRDYARLGKLYLDSGRWNGKQIVPEDWVLASLTPDAPHLMPGDNPYSSSDTGYGFQWWVPESSEGEFLARGIYNQFIYVNPTHKIVIIQLPFQK